MNYQKHKKPERAKAVDELMISWADPKMVSGSLGISTNIAHRYIRNLGYQRRYITNDEILLVTKYRLAKQSPTQ